MGEKVLAKIRVCAGLNEVLQFINGNTGFFYNAVQGALFNLFMIGHNDRCVFCQIVHEYMATPLMINNISDSSKGFYDLGAGECFAHRLISTSFMIAVGADLIWFTFSRP